MKEEVKEGLLGGKYQAKKETHVYLWIPDRKKKAEVEVNDYYYLTKFGSEQHSPHKS